MSVFTKFPFHTAGSPWQTPRVGSHGLQRLFRASPAAESGKEAEALRLAELRPRGRCHRCPRTSRRTSRRRYRPACSPRTPRTQLSATVSQDPVRASRACLRTLWCSRGCGCVEPGHVRVSGRSGWCCCRCSVLLRPTVRALGAAQPTERWVRGASLGGGGSSRTRSDPPEHAAKLLQRCAPPRIVVV